MLAGLHPCGEAPFLTTRYDAATGESIPLAERIGILDRKLRVVNERTRSQNSWRKYARCAYQATYGYEFQGDNLLLARMNLLKTFEEYYEARWSTDPSATELKGIAKIISWNIWQMDGLTGLLPYKKPQDQYIMNGWERKKGDPGIEDECKIYDWRKNEGKKIEMFNNIKGDGCF